MLDGEPLSPELVLVCPDLAERARALLPDRPELWTRQDAPVARTSPDFESVGLPDLNLKPDGHDATQQRLEELTSLVDRIAIDWEKVDGRLAQLERAVARMEAALAVAATPPAPWLEAQHGIDEALPPAGPEQEARTRTGLMGTLVVVASVMAAMVAVELLPSLGDRPRLAVVSEGAVPTGGDPAGQPSGDSRAGTTVEAPLGRTTGETAAPTPRRTAPAASTRPTPPTIERPDETEPTTAPRPSPATPRATTAPPPAQAGAGGTRSAPSPPPTRTTAPSDFTPARVFLWPAADGATFYAVTFLRNGSTFYSARVSRPRLTLPASITFRPGSYRWIVRPGTAGQPLRSPIVDSTFTVEPS
jgi:hypothetical protein